jgi:hypothetical protein
VFESSIFSLIQQDIQVNSGENQKGVLYMKIAYPLSAALILVVLLSGCKNRFETYEPYSSFDERMAAEANKPHAPAADEYQNRYSAVGDDTALDHDQVGIPVSMSGKAAAGSVNSEIHPVNIGALY